MDLDHFERILQSLEYKGEQIRSTAEYCINNNVHNEYQVAKLLEKHFNLAVSPTIRASFLFVISDIFLLSNLKKDKTFFKSLSVKAKLFLQQLANQQPPLDYDLSLVITRMVDKWADEQMFVSSYADKLKIAAGPLYERVKQQRSSGKGEARFNKYKKTFLMELLDVKEFPPTERIYASFVEMNELQAKLTGFYQAYNKLGLQTMSNPSQQILARAKELLTVSESHRDRLEKIICAYHEGFSLLRQATREQFDRFGSE